jgi:class 3 adenylate cyclase
LPSLYASRWKKAAILFADIKNFFPLEERLRQTYARDEDTQHVREILNRHCMEMSKIVTESKGRVERFFGTGLVAIFGEHDEEYSKAAASAVYAATRMTHKFEEMKPNLLKRTVCDDYEIEYNQHVNVNLAIGIDFGTVLFEYLGDDHHQKFTAIGDHVNMAEHLMNQASGYARQGSQYRPILFSPTIERLTHPWIEPGDKQFEQIYDQRTGLTFPTYGIFPKAFDTDLFKKCVEDKSGTLWNDVWKGLPRPY